ncbi:unnamed protein product [Choristocarpus tenellus]
MDGEKTTNKDDSSTKKKKKKKTPEEEDDTPGSDEGMLKKRGRDEESDQDQSEPDADQSTEEALAAMEATKVDGNRMAKTHKDETVPTKRPRTRSMDAAESVAESQVVGAPVDHPSIDTFDISETTKGHLRARGIGSLFPIQALTFEHVMEGKDLIGRARTGMGKTLAFAVPVIEQLLKFKGTLKPGRPPRVLVMAPTRELAKQVATDFEMTAPSLRTTCIYGGAPYRPQACHEPRCDRSGEDAFRRGLDIVVGTPGRLLDHVDRGNLILSETAFLILDEADQMLDMGFKEEMEKVFEACRGGGEEGGRQVLLFSATMPPWVDKVARECMRSDRIFIDLVGEGSAKASKDVKHIGIPCHWTR